jgi:hypothetical protein
MGIEPTSEAWEASILPLYDARSRLTLPNPRKSCKMSPFIRIGVFPLQFHSPKTML